MPAIAFIGDSNPTSSFGLGTLSIPTIQSVQEKILTAVVYGLKNTISKANGYFNNIGDVVAQWQNPEEYHNYPAFLATWGDDSFTNTVQGGNSFGGYNAISDLIVVAYLKEREDIRIEKDRIKHDVLKYFGSNCQIPDANGDSTAFNSVVYKIFQFGDLSNKPFGGLEFHIKVYYRFELSNPAQSF